MPRVGNRSFPYSAKGKAAAAKARMPAKKLPAKAAAKAKANAFGRQVMRKKR